MPMHSRLKYHLRAWNMADASAVDMAIFEPLLVYVFECRNLHVAMALGHTSKALHQQFCLLLDQYCQMRYTSPAIYPWEMTCTRPHARVPLLPTRGRVSAVFGVCACCGAAGDASKARGGFTLSLCYNIRTNKRYVAPFCRDCNSCEWLCGFEDRHTVSVPDACVCAYRNIFYVLKNMTLRAEYISQQVFEHSMTKQTKLFTQFVLHRSDGYKMVVAIESHKFKKCVGPAKYTYQMRAVTDIHTILAEGINVTHKRPTLRLPGSVFHSFVQSPNDGFCYRVKRECYHHYKVDSGDSRGHWKMIDCRPCWQRHKLGVPDLCRCDHMYVQ